MSIIKKNDKVNSENLNNLIDVLSVNGYEKCGHGYKKVTKHNTHWITLFGCGEFQMFAYSTSSHTPVKEYDTGVIGYASRLQFQVLIDVFTSNHN